MNWSILAFIAPAIWAACNYIDKHLLSRYFSEGSTAVLVIISGLTAFITALAIWLFGTDVFSASIIARTILMLNGALFIISFIPYFYALREADASVAIPVFQTIPVFGYIFGLIFLKEVLSVGQILAGLLIIIGAIGLSLELKGGFKLKLRPLILMLISSFLIAIGNLIFKKVALQESFWVASFWEYLGSLSVSLFLFIFFKNHRQNFLRLFKKERIAAVGLSSLQELLNVSANLIFNFSVLLAPLAIVSVVVNGLQPFYVLLFGVVLTSLFPGLFNEKITKGDLAQKIIFVSIIFIGTIILR